MAAFDSAQISSNKSKGDSREGFVKYFLENILPSVYRVGRCGDIVNSDGQKSGEVDIVIENPFSPHFITGPSGSKIYLAEGVAAVIEVKSNLDKHWNDVKKKVKKIKEIKRNLKPVVFRSGIDLSSIPTFVVAYKGTHVATKFNEFNLVDGILIIEKGDFAAHNIHVEGAAGIANFIFSLFNMIDSIKLADMNWQHYTLDNEMRNLLKKNNQL